MRNAEFEAEATCLQVKDDQTTLKGRVKARYERDLAECAPWSASGVGAVRDRLSIA